MLRSLGLWRLCLIVCLLGAFPTAAMAQEASTALSSERQQISYFIGMDVGRSLKPLAPDLDLQAFQAALERSLAGAEPEFTPEQAQALGAAIGKRAAVRAGQTAEGELPELSAQQAGKLVGGDVGRSLRRVPETLEVPVLMQAVKTMFEGGFPLLGQADTQRLSEVLQQRMEQATREAAQRNLAEGEAFLARNRTGADVQSTVSGLQYQVLRPGSGARPSASDTVKVHYQGTLLDGSVFDSSYERGEPATFGLGQVIPGWTEGLALMSTGAKYRFWIPARLGYGERGTPDGSIGPNAVLVFDVELLDIVQPR